MKKLIFLIFIVTFTSYSQESGFMDFWKAEKVKITNERLLELLKNGNSNEFKDLNNAIQTNENGLVSGDPQPESELHAAINPLDGNNIVVSPIRNGNGINDPLTCPVYFTKDAGKTWKKSTFRNTPINTFETVIGGGDPVFAFDADGKLYFTWINLAYKLKGNQPDSSIIAIYWASSIDGGETWTREANHNFAFDKQKYTNGSSYGLKKFYDKQWMACDVSNSKYRNNLYVSHVVFDLLSNSSNIYVKTKKQNQSQFIDSAVLITKNKYDLAQFGSVDVDGRGVVHVSFYGRTKANGITTSAIYYTYSVDGGETFAPEIKATNIYFSAGSNFGTTTTDLIPGITSSRAYPYPQIVADKSNNEATKNNVYITFTATGINSNAKYGNNVYIVKSNNNGNSWQSPKTLLPINSDYIHKFYASSNINPDGVVVSSFFNMSGNASADYVTCFSFDGGDSFLKTNASTVPTNFNTVGKKNNSFGIGEYNQTVSNKDFVFPVWSDGRNGDGNLDLYITKIPLSEAKQLSVDDVVLINPLIKIGNVSPNPINKLVTVEFTLDANAVVTFSLVDMIGNEIDMISKNKYNEGTNMESFDLSRFANGSYYLKLNANNKSEVVKIAIEK